jgi:hypothetical protein
MEGRCSRYRYEYTESIGLINNLKVAAMVTYLIISLLLIVFSAIGIKGLFKRKNYKQKQLRIAIAFERIVQQFKLAVEYSEFLCHRFIGLDRRNKKLVLIDHCGDEKQEQCISLYEIGESKIIHIKDESQNTKIILLELRYKRSNKLLRFCFYNKDYDPVIELGCLSRKAIHWKTKIDIHKHRGNANLEAEYVL